MTKLFGRSPAGLNSTGEGDLRNYYDYVDTLRENILRPILERLLPVVCMSAWGEVPEELDIRFPPLWTPTAKEVAEIGEKKAAAIRDIFQAGLLRADTAQKELKKLADGLRERGASSVVCIARTTVLLASPASVDVLIVTGPEKDLSIDGGFVDGTFVMRTPDVGSVGALVINHANVVSARVISPE